MKNSFAPLALAFCMTMSPQSLRAADYRVSSTHAIQGIRASVVAGSTVSALTVNFNFLQNLGTDMSNPYFVIHQQAKKPANCPDFRGTRVPVTNRTLTTQTLDLSRRPDVVEALQDYHCIIVDNIYRE